MILRLSKIAGAVCVTSVASAGLFRLPITRTTVGWDFRFMSMDEGVESHQTTLKAQGKSSGRVQQARHREDIKNERSSVDMGATSVASMSLTTGGHHRPDEIMYFSLYTTPISIGSPPVNLTALIDTSWSPFFVPSANCTLDPHEWYHCVGHAPLYNSTESTTYRADLTPSKMVYNGYSSVYTWGKISQDNLHVADMEIKDQVFEEATAWHRGYITRDDYFDTALGLSLHQTSEEWGNFSAPSPFQNMVQQDLLDENIFALRLARTDDEIGELILGGLPEALDRNEMIEVPLNHSRDGGGDEWWDFFTSSGWQISAQSISMDFYNESVPVMSSERTAIVSSSHPYIALAEEDAAAANRAIGLVELDDWVDCETRADLPNVTFDLGPERLSITLTPWDYLIEVYDDLYDELKCVGPFQEIPVEYDMGFIILGAAFLNGIWSVWDAERETISFMNRPLPSGTTGL